MSCVRRTAAPRPSVTASASPCHESRGPRHPPSLRPLRPDDGGHGTAADDRHGHGRHLPGPHSRGDASGRSHRRGCVGGPGKERAGRSPRSRAFRPSWRTVPAPFPGSPRPAGSSRTRSNASTRGDRFEWSCRGWLGRKTGAIGSRSRLAGRWDRPTIEMIADHSLGLLARRPTRPRQGSATPSSVSPGACVGTGGDGLAFFTASDAMAIQFDVPATPCGWSAPPAARASPPRTSARCSPLLTRTAPAARTSDIPALAPPQVSAVLRQAPSRGPIRRK